jgi:hypothetical protein
MKTVKKNVYYCEHCKKRSLSAFHMKKHETGCTNNPDRECKLCECGVNIKEIVEGYKKRYAIKTVMYKDSFGGFPIDKSEWIGEPITINEVIKDADGCPNCVLSILRQSKLNTYPFEGFYYDYKKEVALYYSEYKQKNYEY